MEVLEVRGWFVLVGLIVGLCMGPLRNHRSFVRRGISDLAEGKVGPLHWLVRCSSSSCSNDPWMLFTAISTSRR